MSIYGCGICVTFFCEELDEFAGDGEIRSVQQSVLRGGSKFVVFKSFNPPISKSNWANEYVALPKSDALRHKSCYLDVPKEWLGQQFLDDAEDLKQTNPRAYEHEYLGNAVGTGGEVFDNLDIREITDDEIKRFDHIYMGIDFGWYPDPFHWSKSHYDAARKTLYIFDEFRANKLSNAEAWNSLVMKKGVTGSDLITADSAEPKSVADFREYGALCRGAVKGPDSVRYGMKWLQSLKSIVIDPARCPYTAKEFSHYEYERTANDEIMSSFPDADNHCLAGDTIVNTVDGDFKITELIGKTGKVKCYDTESGEETVSRFYDVKKTLRNAQLYQITLEDGGILKLTEDHPVYTQRGWVMVKDLKPDDGILKIDG